MEEKLQEEQIPQEAVQEMPPENPYDIGAESAELDGINKELSDIEASIENDFTEFIADLVDNDPTLEELFFSDRKLFFKKVIEEQNKFVKSIIEPKQARASELQSQITTKNELRGIEAIKQDFQARHPEVDIKELIHFFAEDLSPRIQEQIKAQPIEQFFDLVYELYTQAKSQAESLQNAEAQQEAPQELPQQAQGVAVDSEQADTNAFLPMNRN